MSFRLPRLPGESPSSITAIWQKLQLWWQRLCEQIEAQEALQNETINNLRRIGSHTEPTSIFSANDIGELTISDHTRVYADGTSLAVTGTTVTGLLNNTWYGVYYDDTTLADTTPTYVVTTNIDQTPAAKAAGRHFCGLILTPKAASGDIVESGGTYSTGSGTVGGETEGHEVVP